MSIAYQQILDCLDATAQNYQVMELQDDICAIITERGGRLLGPFYKRGNSLFWVNDALQSPDKFKDWLASADWNMGGERIWIAPEIQYNIADRSDFWGSYDLPPQMDPGHYQLEAFEDSVQLRQQLTLTAHNLADGVKTLQVTMRFRQVRDPLQHLSTYEKLLDGVIFAGYEQNVTLKETSSDNIMSASWNLVQLNPGGRLLIPASPQLESTIYFGNPPEDAVRVQQRHLNIQLDAQNQFKVGYKAVHVCGRMGYLNQKDADRSCLLVRSFYNNPSSVYVEEPPDKPGQQGDSIHVYNGGGQFGAFGEMECQGQTIGGETGRSKSIDNFIMWVYLGPLASIEAIANHLLGIG